MATPLPRTATDDALDALERLAGIERELPNLRAWIERIAADPAAARELAPQAQRLAQIVEVTAGSIRAGMREVQTRPRTLLEQAADRQLIG
jgi:hypothetical protein